MLTVIDRTTITHYKNKDEGQKAELTAWVCKCECGNERIIPAHNLRCGRTHSCGCDNHTLPDYKCLYNKFVAIAKKTKTECALLKLLNNSKALLDLALK